MTMQAGDKVTIRRGELKGEVGEVKLTQGDQVALIMERDGALELVNRSNIKELVEATITQAELAALINSNVNIDDLVHALDAKLPGFAAKAGWLVAVDEDGEPGSTGPSYGAGPGEGR